MCKKTLPTLVIYFFVVDGKCERSYQFLTQSVQLLLRSVQVIDDAGKGIQCSWKSPTLQICTLEPSDIEGCLWVAYVEAAWRSM